MRIHQQKLEQIAGRGISHSGQGFRTTSVAGPKVAKEVGKELKKFKLDKARSKDFQVSEKNFMISKDN